MSIPNFIQQYTLVSGNRTKRINAPINKFKVGERVSVDGEYWRVQGISKSFPSTEDQSPDGEKVDALV